MEWVCQWLQCQCRDSSSLQRHSHTSSPYVCYQKSLCYQVRGLKCEIWYEWPHGRGESRNTYPNWESQWKVSLCCCRGWPKLGQLLFCRSGNGTNNSSVMGRITTSQYFSLGQDTTWRHPTCPSGCPVSIVLPDSLLCGEVSPGPTQQQRSSFGRGFRTSIEQTWRMIATWVKPSYKMLKWKLDKYVVLNVFLCSRA